MPSSWSHVCHICANSCCNEVGSEWFFSPILHAYWWWSTMCTSTSIVCVTRCRTIIIVTVTTIDFFRSMHYAYILLYMVHPRNICVCVALENGLAFRMMNISYNNNSIHHMCNTCIYIYDYIIYLSLSCELNIEQPKCLIRFSIFFSFSFTTPFPSRQNFLLVL